MIAISFQDMPDTSKVWVYQSGRPFSQSEKVRIEQYLEGFTAQWKAHGTSLAASFSIEYNQFIVLAVDESHHQASGCSIDSSVGLIRTIEQELGLTLLDRTQVAALKADQIELFPFNQAKKMIESKKITPDTLVFDNSIQNLGQFRQLWEIPAKSSWMSRFFN